MYKVGDKVDVLNNAGAVVCQDEVLTVDAAGAIHLVNTPGYFNEFGTQIIGENNRYLVYIRPARRQQWAY